MCARWDRSSPTKILTSFASALGPSPISVQLLTGGQTLNVSYTIQALQFSIIIHPTRIARIFLLVPWTCATHCSCQYVFRFVDEPKDCLPQIPFSVNLFMLTHIDVDKRVASLERMIAIVFRRKVNSLSPSSGSKL